MAYYICCLISDTLLNHYWHLKTGIIILVICLVINAPYRILLFFFIENNRLRQEEDKQACLSHRKTVWINAESVSVTSPLRLRTTSSNCRRKMFNLTSIYSHPGGNFPAAKPCRKALRLPTGTPLLFLTVFFVSVLFIVGFVQTRKYYYRFQTKGNKLDHGYTVNTALKWHFESVRVTDSLRSSPDLIF